MRKNTLKKVDKTIVSSVVVLPSLVVEKINTIFENEKTRNHVFSFISQLTNATHEKYKTSTGFVPFPASRFRIHFGYSYHNWLNPLLESQIVMKNDYYSKAKQICLYYWINPMYFNIPESAKTFCDIDYDEVPIKLSIKKMSREELKFQNQVTKDFVNLKYDELKLKSIVKKYIDNFSLDDYLIGQEITQQKFNVIYTDSNGLIQKRAMSREMALKNSFENNQDLIYDKKTNKYYSYDFKYFIRVKKSAVERYYLEAISKLVNKKVYAKRNKTNFRLDTNITNCPSVLFKQVMDDNGLCQIDMSNAQFAIFAYIISKKILMIPLVEDIPQKKRINLEIKEVELKRQLDLLVESDDFKKFNELAYRGDLYEEIYKQLELNDRNEAKKIMFQLLFSSEKLKNDLKNQLLEIFPNVVKYIDRYKKYYGYKNFSIGLQKKESQIFIDLVYVKLKDCHISTITRHDSIIVSFENEIKARRIINGIFKSINFNCNLEREGRISNRFHELANIKQKELDSNIDKIVFVATPIDAYNNIEINLTNDDDIKRKRAPKTSSLNFNR